MDRLATHPPDPRKLSHYADGRDNNFNFLRFIAAFAVLIDHSFVLIAGTADAEPLRKTLGIALGNIAVDAFFITSGFLVTSSLFARNSALGFIWARILRIYPALLVMVVLCICALGLWFTNLQAGAYFAHPRTALFALKNSTLVTGIEFYLPGVFSSLPWKKMVNGSLWTMPYEIWMYIALAVLWIVCRVFRSLQTRAAGVLILSVAAIALAAHVWNHFAGHPEDLLFRLAFMFFSGASCFVLRGWIVLSRTLFGVALAALLVSPVHIDLFFLVYELTFAYVLLWLAYVPAGRVRDFNRIGDYSYGIYIYAFPIQQALVATIAGLSVAGLISLSGLLVITMGALSWHVVEKYALRLKFSPAPAG